LLTAKSSHPEENGEKPEKKKEGKAGKFPLEELKADKHEKWVIGFFSDRGNRGERRSPMFLRGGNQSRCPASELKGSVSRILANGEK